MATKTVLRLRKTHRYVGEYQHLDRWQRIGTAKLLPERLVREPGDDIADNGTYLRTAVIPAGQDPDASARALVDVLTMHGCSHEYDCCGCMSWTTRVVRRIGKRRFVLATDYSRNF